MHLPIDDRQNYPFRRLQLVVKSLDTQIKGPIDQNSLKVPKIVKKTNEKNVDIKLWGLE